MSRPFRGLMGAGLLLLFTAGCGDGEPPAAPPVVDTSPPPVDAEGTRRGTPGAPVAARPGLAVPADRRPPEVEEPPKNEAALMTAATADARASVQQFIDALTNPQPTQSGFSAKIAVHEGELVEHFWVLVRFEEGQFVGQINRDPKTVSNVSNGDEIRALPYEVDDWMYLDDRHLVGGRTIRVQRELMSPDERQQFERSLGYIID